MLFPTFQRSKFMLFLRKNFSHIFIKSEQVHLHFGKSTGAQDVWSLATYYSKKFQTPFFKVFYNFYHVNPSLISFLFLSFSSSIFLLLVLYSLNHWRTNCIKQKFHFAPILSTLTEYLYIYEGTIQANNEPSKVRKEIIKSMMESKGAMTWPKGVKRKL